MKLCTVCGYAEWRRTAAGKLHPSGAGRCKYPYSVVKLPASMFWINIPSPSGGAINRRVELADHCVYWKRTALTVRNTIMKVEIFIGLGTQKKRIWKGDLEILPRIGEDVVIDKAGKVAYTVEYIHYWLADGPRVEIFVL